MLDKGEKRKITIQGTKSGSVPGGLFVIRLIVFCFTLSSSILYLAPGVSLAKHTASRIIYGPDHLYVTIKGKNHFYTIDRRQDNVIKKVNVGSPPCGGFITKDGKQFYIALGELDQIVVVNTSSNAVSARISLKKDGSRYMDPGGMAVSPDGTLIYVANESGDSLSVIDLETRKVKKTIPIGFGPQDVVLTPDGRYGYVTDFYSVWVIDLSDFNVIKEIPFRDPTSDRLRTYLLEDGEEVFRGPRDIVMSPDGRNAYVALEDSGEIAIIDVRKNEVEEMIPVGSYPGGLALSPKGESLYIAHRDSDEISVLDTGQRKIIQRIKVGQDPWDITFSPDGDEVFVVNQGDPSVSVIDPKTFHVKGTMLLGMIGFKSLLPRGLRRLFYVWRKEKKRSRTIPFAFAIFSVFFLVPFLFFVLSRDEVKIREGTAWAASPEAQERSGSSQGIDFKKISRGSPGAYGGRIAFESRRTGHWEIYLMNADGTDQTRLTHTQANNRAPFWSPEGRRMAFVTDRDGNQEIYLMDSDGSNLRNLSRSGKADFSPSWSPDGSRIAFVSTRDGKRNIYITGIDGQDQVRLTLRGDNWNPNWSPDSLRIAFVSNRDGNNEIYLMEADGRNQINLTRHPSEDGRGSHSWSPDGSKIAWVTNRDGNWEIYVMDAGGGHPINVTRHPGEEGIGMFVWSPDGKQIAFISKRDSNEEVYVVNADGTGSTNLSRSPGMDDVPLWSPDGRKLAFVSNRTGFDEIYVMNADGSNQIQLTNTKTREDFPRWQPSYNQPVGTIGMISSVTKEMIR